MTVNIKVYRLYIVLPFISTEEKTKQKEFEA